MRTEEFINLTSFPPLPRSHNVVHIQTRLVNVHDPPSVYMRMPARIPRRNDPNQCFSRSRRLRASEYPEINALRPFPLLTLDLRTHTVDRSLRSRSYRGLRSLTKHHSSTPRNASVRTPSLHRSLGHRDGRSRSPDRFEVKRPHRFTFLAAFCSLRRRRAIMSARCGGQTGRKSQSQGGGRARGGRSTGQSRLRRGGLGGGARRRPGVRRRRRQGLRAASRCRRRRRRRLVPQAFCGVVVEGRGR